jgi:phospholipid N-methyltransferase
MTTYRLSPFATLIESHLFAEATQYAVFHRLTGQLLEIEPPVLAFAQALTQGKGFSLDPDQISDLGEMGPPVRALIEFQLAIPVDVDPLAPFVDYYLGRPMQNPAVTWRSETGAVSVASISMAEHVYSPETGKLPLVTEEIFPELISNILAVADGTKTLRQIYAARQGGGSDPRQYDQEFRQAIKFLTEPDRQLIKLAPTVEDFANPYYPANLVPGNLYHSSRWTEREPEKSIGDFHLEGIDDAAWEFDIIEPTINHGLRFPSELLGGLDYGTRFCDAVFSDGFSGKTNLEVLEVGGGTGSFARSFIQRAQQNGKSIAYQIMDLSPALAESQRRMLTDIDPPVGHLNQDAVHLNLPGRKFDLIMSNEVIADFPVAAVEREGVQLGGPGAPFVKQYELAVEDAPARFYVNSGVFEFLERAWTHLNPGGRLILSEYGSKTRYPAESFHLNHSEFTIHFGHVAQCARKIGFECRLEPLTEFLRIDDQLPVLCGRDEHILCLSYVFEKHTETMPFALFSERDFKARFGELAERLSLSPIRFLALRHNFHYGPSLQDFFVLTLQKPIS